MGHGEGSETGGLARRARRGRRLEIRGQRSDDRGQKTEDSMEIISHSKFFESAIRNPKSDIEKCLVLSA